MNNHAIVKMKNPEQAIELNGLLKSKYKIMAEAFNTSGILTYEKIISIFYFISFIKPFFTE